MNSANCAGRKGISIHKLLIRAIAFLFSISMLVAILLTAVDWASFSRPFYARSYKELNTASGIGISQEDLDAATEQLLDYIQVKTPQLDIEVRLLNTPTQEKVMMFNLREREHMVDVKNLYIVAMRVRMIVFIIAILCLLTLLLYLRVRRNRNDFRYIRQGLITALLVFLLLLAAIGVYAALDFEGFWTSFHLLVFDNDLWILNPLIDRLIMMVPSAFFSALVRKIILTVLAALVLYNILVLTLSTYLIRQSRQKLAE